MDVAKNIRKDTASKEETIPIQCSSSYLLERAVRNRSSETSTFLGGTSVCSSP